MEDFKKLCNDTYGLHSAHYFTSSHLSGDAFIKILRGDLHLLKDREHFEMAENMIRGGVASIFSKGIFRGNNKYLNGFNPDYESIFVLILDANSLYGRVLEKLPLPLKDFQEIEIPLQDIHFMDIDSDVG